MQVLKFGGSSVANAENMSRVIDIVANAVDRDRTILVTSAISGCTDTLIKIGTLAAERDESYKALIDELQQKHHEIINSILPREKQMDSTQVCDTLFDSLRSIAQGVFLLGELSNSLIMERIKAKTKGKHLWVRTIGSSMIGYLFDTLPFVLIAFLGVVSTHDLLYMIAFQYVSKLLIESVFGTPMAYAVVYWLKRHMRKHINKDM